MTIEKTATAFVNGELARCHNASTDGSTYTLHKTVIARKTAGGTNFNWGGYYTPTTAAHMNAILRAMGSDCRVPYAQDRDDRTTSFTI